MSPLRSPRSRIVERCDGGRDALAEEQPAPPDAPRGQVASPGELVDGRPRDPKQFGHLGRRENIGSGQRPHDGCPHPYVKREWMRRWPRAHVGRRWWWASLAAALPSGRANAARMRRSWWESWGEFLTEENWPFDGVPVSRDAFTGARAAIRAQLRAFLPDDIEHPVAAWHDDLPVIYVCGLGPRAVAGFRREP
jgi:hypothetical protein